MRTLLHSSASSSKRFIPPLAVRELQAAMKLKHLSLDDVARKARLPYLTVCRLLKGRLTDPERLAKVRSAIESTRTPEATV